MTTPDGIFLGLPMADYEPIQAIRSGDLKEIDESPVDWAWRRSPLYEPPPKPEGMILGDCQHTLTLYGRDAFDLAYREAKIPPDGLLDTTDEIKAWLDGERPPGCSKWKKADWQSYARGLGAPLLDDWRAEHDPDDGRYVITNPTWLSALVLVDKQIRAHSTAGPWFRDGLSEVTVVWTEGERRFKARFDKIHPAASVDLKTSARLNKRPDKLWAIKSEIVSYGYYIQAAHYHMARLAMRALDLPVIGEATAAERATVEAIKAAETWEWAWVFAKTLDCPQPYLFRLTNPGRHFAILEGARRIDQALATLDAWNAAQGAGALWFDMPEWIEDGTKVDRWPDAFVAHAPQPTLPEHDNGEDEEA